jgi:hypothetical protein
MEAGAASVRWGITDRDGASVLDVSRPDGGPGYDYVRVVLGELMAGQTSHAGALLSPLGVRFVVAGADDLPADAVARLDAQVDLDLVPAEGLLIYRNARALPPAFVTQDRAFKRAARADSLVDIAGVGDVSAAPMRSSGTSWTSASRGGFGYVADQDASGWRVSTSTGERPASPAFGWAIGFQAPSGSFSLRYGGQAVRTAELAVLAGLWLAVLWVTRRPGRR